MLTGWVLFMFLVLLGVTLAMPTLNTIIFFIGLAVCFTGFFSFHLINRDDNFFKTQDELEEIIKELNAKKIKTDFLNKALLEKIKEYDSETN